MFTSTIGLLAYNQSIHTGTARFRVIDPNKSFGRSETNVLEAALKALQALLPFIGQYPTWVRVCAVLWLLASAGMVAILILAPRSAPPKGGTSHDQVQSGQSNVQAGRDI